MKTKYLKVLAISLSVVLLITTVSVSTWFISWKKAEKYFTSHSPLLGKDENISRARDTHYYVSFSNTETSAVSDSFTSRLCQSKSFDPQTQKIVYSDIINSDLYHIEGDSSQNFIKIDGFRQISGEVMQLPQPYALTQYVYSCRMNKSYMLDIKNVDRRITFLNYVVSFAVTPDGKKIFALQFDPEKNEYKRRIVNLDTEKITPLQDSVCAVEQFRVTDNEHIIGISQSNGKNSDLNSVSDADHTATICIWDFSGELEKIVNSANVGPIDDYLNFGLLPQDSDILYVYTYAQVDASYTNQCSIFLYDYKNDVMKAFTLDVVPVSSSSMTCPYAEFDFSNFSFESQSLRYRYRHVYSLQSTTVPWRTITIES